MDDKIKLSFFKLAYQNYLPLIETKYFRLAQELEIAVMKLIALLRATYRDYVDLFFLLKRYKLEDIFSLAKKIHKNFESGIYLKCLLSYDDVEISPIKFVKGFEVTEKEVFAFLEKTTKEYLKRIK